MKKTVLLAAFAIAMCGKATLAETFGDALKTTYENNPVIKAQMEALNIAKENRNQANANWWPALTLSGSWSKARAQVELDGIKSPSETLTQYGAQADIVQNIFEGFKTINDTRSASYMVDAAEYAMKAYDQTVLLQAGTAYVDVRRDDAVLELQRNNEKLLQQELASTQNRFRVGQLTRTDVSQAQAGLASAKADRIGAEGNLKSVQATYMRVTGKAPENLSPAPSFENVIPKTLAQAIDIAQKNSPDLLASVAMEKSAQADSSASIGALAPTVDLFASAGREYNQPLEDYTTDSVAAGIRAQWSLFDKGVTWSKIRQTKHIANQKRMELADTRRVSRENTTKSWETLTAVNAQIISIKAQIEANRLAADGVKREARAGSRTVLDVLNAEQALLNSRVSLAQAERDRIVASMQLLAAIGRLNLNDMGIN